MEFFLIIFVMFAYGFVSDYLEDKKKTKNHDSYTPAVDTTIIEEEYKPTVVNNYYTQNNYNNKTTDEDKGHSAKVWERMGYKVRYGETYSYKFYGNEIFSADQVEKIGSNHVKYSESGLARKLLKNTGSKKHAKNILVDQYGYSQVSAKSLVGYNG